jgi:hypothetical protein
MSVPKTPVNEYDFAFPRKDHVGAAWQSAVQSIPVAHAVDQTTDEQFRLGILAAHPAHTLASFGGRHGVHAGSPPRAWVAFGKPSATVFCAGVSTLARAQSGIRHDRSGRLDKLAPITDFLVPSCGLLG